MRRQLVARATVGRLVAVVATGAFAATVWSTAPVGAVGPAARQPCRVGVTYRLLTSMAPRTVVVVVRSANVRRGPGTDCARVTSVSRGTRLAVSGARARVGSSTWLQVTGRFGFGWVAATLVR
jgi:hypothetical protein